MNITSFKGPIDQNTFKILYYRNKVYLLPASLIVLSVALIYFAVIPQIKDYFSYLDEEKNIKEKIAIVKNNTQALTVLDESDLDKKFKIVSSALPPEKDFGGILQAIAKAASDANVTLGDFSFEIGQLSSSGTKVTNALPIEISLSIKGGIEKSKQFLNMLTERFPLSEATSIGINESSSTISVLFYYKPISPINFNSSKQLQLFSKDQLTLLDTLASFKSNSGTSVETLDTSLPLLSQ